MSSIFPNDRVRFAIVTGFTSLNLLIGVLSLIAATTGSIRLAAWGLLCCVLFDACDGLLARRWRVASAFGAQLDSLADMTSFITAGATLIYYWVQPVTPYWLIAGASALYVLAGAVRLARFNCTLPQPGYFQGIPTTFVAAAIAANYLVAPAINAYYVILLATLLAVLMVSLLPYPKPTPDMLRRCPRWCFAMVGVGALVQPAWTVWLLTASYIGLGPAIWLRRRLQARS
jgi:CDP-diacylglycerol--serine O-phosphatidyltransferase